LRKNSRGDADRGSTGGNVSDDNSSGTDERVVTDGDRPKDDCSRTDGNPATDLWVASVSAHIALPTKRYSVIKQAVIPDDGCLSDDYTGTVVDEEAFTDTGTGMNFDERPPTHDLRHQPSDESKSSLPQPVGESVPPHRVQTGEHPERFESVARCWIVPHRRANVVADAKKRSHLIENTLE
jgi:hypothetical protein